MDRVDSSGVEQTGVVLVVADGTMPRGSERGGKRGRREEPQGEKGTAISGGEQLAKLVREQGRYDIVEVGYQRFGEPSVREAVDKVIAQGAGRVIVVPTVSANSDLREMVAALQDQHPGVEIIGTDQPLHAGKYADYIVNKIREHDRAYVAREAELGLLRLSALKQGETGMIHDFEAGHTLVSRLSALGFTPNTRVTMIQNYGHGPVIVSVRDTRIALGRGEAGKIWVRRPEDD